MSDEKLTQIEELEVQQQRMGKEIAELKERIEMYFDVDSGHLELHREAKKEINELKERIGEIDKILIAITEGRILELNTINNIQKALREFFEDHGLFLYVEKLDGKIPIEPELMERIMSVKSIPMDKTEKKPNIKHDGIITRVKTEPEPKCPIYFGDKLGVLNQIKDEEKRYHAIQDFINEEIINEPRKDNVVSKE